MLHAYKDKLHILFIKMFLKWKKNKNLRPYFLLNYLLLDIAKIAILHGYIIKLKIVAEIVFVSFFLQRAVSWVFYSKLHLRSAP